MTGTRAAKCRMSVQIAPFDLSITPDRLFSRDRDSGESHANREMTRARDWDEPCSIDRLHAQPGQLLELPGAVAQLLRRHAEQVEHRQLQVGQRRVFRIHEMAAAL